MELKFAKDQGLCTTLSYVAFRDSESLLGDAKRIQRTPRSMPAACSLTRAMEPPFLLQVCRLYGQRTSDWRRTAIPENTVLTSAEVTDLIAGVEINATDHGNRTTLNFSLSWTSISCFLRVNRTLQWTCVTALRTVPDDEISLAARDTVVLAVEKLTDEFLVLSPVARGTVEPAVGTQDDKPYNA